ncbi:DNA-binding transcriptional LysR family regulator [Bradyrhizobium sp. LB8.2]
MIADQRIGIADVLQCEVPGIALEQSLGQTLFRRTTDGFVLTDEGTAVLRHAERIEEEALALERRASGAETQLDGLLRLSSSDWFGTVMLSPAIAAFGKRHPKVIVELLTDARLYSLPRREVASLILGYARPCGACRATHTNCRSTGRRKNIRLYRIRNYRIFRSLRPKEEGVSRSSRTRAGRRWTWITSARMVSQGGEP